MPPIPTPLVAICLRRYSLYSGHIVVSCLTPAGVREVAMSPEALTGFLAWLEAAPPGRRARPR